MIRTFSLSVWIFVFSVEMLSLAEQWELIQDSFDVHLHENRGSTVCQVFKRGYQILYPPLENSTTCLTMNEDEHQKSPESTPIARPMTAFRRKKQKFTQKAKKCVSFVYHFIWSMELILSCTLDLLIKVIHPMYCKNLKKGAHQSHLGRKKWAGFWQISLYRVSHFEV